MKKLLRSIGIILPFMATTAYAQIPNAGFENWTTVGSYEVPTGWGTMNNTTATYSMFTATKATPGSPGNSYMKLTSKTINGSVVPGIAVSGMLDTIAKEGMSGVPYTTRSATFSGKWQHMSFGSSPGSVSVLLSRWNPMMNMRDTVAHGMQMLSGMVMSWGAFSINMMYMDSLNAPDSCMIVLRASGSAPANNDYLWVDNLAFTGTVAVYTPPVTTGLHDAHKAGQQIKFNIFPNPSKEQVTINFSEPISNDVSVQITDVTGKLVQQFEAGAAVAGTNTMTVKTHDLVKGIYTIVVKSNKATGSSKLVVD